MKKSIGLDKINTAVFISGTGSNLKNLIKFSYKKKNSYLDKSCCFKQKKCQGFKIR